MLSCTEITPFYTNTAQVAELNINIMQWFVYSDKVRIAHWCRYWERVREWV